ncbi:hypothetical protein [Natrinema sp. CGMCC1.2065]|uniref:hypothetical protein n=1 Tax=Natrinema sp. CGMCC1.2065 TaxID=3445767 RepID=UPI003F4A7AF3
MSENRGQCDQCVNRFNGYERHTAVAHWKTRPGRSIDSPYRHIRVIGGAAIGLGRPLVGPLVDTLPELIDKQKTVLLLSDISVGFSSVHSYRTGLHPSDFGADDVDVLEVAADRYVS